MNFLKDAKCETNEQLKASCPFLHYVERRRDKVIQDDFEFKDFIAQQDQICENFLDVLGLQVLVKKTEYYSSNDREPVLRQGLPSSSYILGVSSKNLS